MQSCTLGKLLKLFYANFFLWSKILTKNIFPNEERTSNVLKPEKFPIPVGPFRAFQRPLEAFRGF